MAFRGVLATLCLLTSSAAMSYVNNYAAETYYYSQEMDSGANESARCPLWHYDKYHNSSCFCGANIHGLVKCDEDKSTVDILSGQCMSYSDNSNEVLVGACPYLCTDSIHFRIFEQTNLSNICNNEIQQNRKGQMCGQCLENHSPSPYSYTLKCADCSNYKHNWIKYMLMAYLPLTIFYLIVLFFRLNALSASMNAFIFVCQIISSPAVMSLLSNYSYFYEKHPVLKASLNIGSVIKSLASFTGLWNLDFFRMVYEPFCLHPNMTTIQIMSLEYAIAVYPLVLIILTYLLIKIHEHFELVRFLWKPVAWLFTRFNDQWRASNSLIEVFATFILLSYVKIINTSFDILMPVQAHNVTGNTVGMYLYYNGSMEYFGNDHLPYAVLAIFMFVTFNLVPLLLLCLYPCRCFQSCLNCCRLNSHVLRTFMDAFQGCYKFEPYDCRYWAGFYLLLRIAVLIIFSLTQSGYFVLVAGILLIPVVALTAVVRPYRETAYNVVDVVILLAFVQLMFSAVGFPLCVYDRRFQGFVNIMFGTAIIVPILYVLALSVYKSVPTIWNKHLKRLYQYLLFRFRVDSICLRRQEQEDPLLQEVANSFESEDDMLLSCQDVPRYNSLLDDYTK